MFFFPGGATSATMAPVQATRAPTPSPVMRRQKPKPQKLLVNEVMSMPRENQA